MNALLAWITPPVVGAVIGYVTNDIAIKMLFRPLVEKRIFGIRLPFTPGILPRQRHQLADNIGRMVARELITEDIIRERIRRNDFRIAIEASVSEYSGRLLSSPIRKLALEIPSFGDKDETEHFGSSDVARLLGGLAERFVASPAFAQIIDGAVSAAVAKLREKTIAELVGGDRSALVRSIADRLSGIISSAVSGSEAAESLADSAARFAESLVAEGKTLGSVLPQDAAESISRIADAAYPVLTDALFRYLEQAPVRAELETHGRVFLRDAIQRLNVFQRFFLSAAQYDRTLHEQMPEIVDDLIRHMMAAGKGEKSRSRFVAAVQESTGRFLSLPVAEAAASVGMESAALARKIAFGLVRILSDHGASDALSRMLTKAVDGLVDEPLGQIIEKRVGIDTPSLVRNLSASLKTLASSNPGSTAARAVDAFLAERGESSVSDLLGIAESGKEKMDRFLTDRVVALIDERLSSALSTLDVRTLVSERIDKLDMESVESIVLDILANQLRWINVFGAILGAIIGLTQAALSVFLR